MFNTDKRLSMFVAVDTFHERSCKNRLAANKKKILDIRYTTISVHEQLVIHAAVGYTES